MEKNCCGQGRLASLDILRGFDLFLLLWLQPVLLSVSGVWSAPWFDTVMHQLDHEVWEGLRCWDLVMPLFLFMTGAAMPFSFAKRLADAGSKRRLYGHIARRVIILFVLGMIVQGNLLALDVDRLQIYNNTLQAIAAGYLIASVILITCRSVVWQCVATVTLMAVYSLPMALWGDWSVDGNFAAMVDRVVIGRWRGDLTYTWVWSSLTFGATVMMGAMAGELMRNKHNLTRRRVAALLTLAGVVLIVAGEVTAALGEPVIKRLWTSSMTLVSGGLCTLLMAFTYWLVDICGVHRGLDWLKIYGMNAITAYCLGEVVNFRSIVESLSYGLEPMMGPWYSIWLTAGNFTILLLLLAAMYRHRIFLKI
ncbi:MAG: DUF5009 domain-containing protein [Bacteroides sp.]|nr:DUF5009 domain-containing protein [Bacteroides sp.]MCM1413037.1 DUF5009 domain-containing protein [Bacteroides sp.]MCM1471743.1 DUF5009 domain-containing protein [Bacteroides sp.]